MGAPVIQFKRGLFQNLPALRAGEPGFTTDKYDLYIGINSTSEGNKFFGSHRYWSKETSTQGSAVNLVEGTSNGSDYISLKSPNSLSGIQTYTFPGTAPSPAAGEQYFLLSDNNGNLSWTRVVSDLYIAGDQGTDTISTGQTVYYSGQDGVRTVVGDNQVFIGLSTNAVDIRKLNISGGSETTSLQNTDLFIVDDGANGTNNKITAENIKTYVLGGGAGANFENLHVSGIATAYYVDATQLKVSGITTLTQLQATTVNSTGIITASNFVGDGASLTNLTYQNITGKTAGVRTEFSVTSTNFGRLTYNSSTGTYNVAGITTAEIRNQLSATSTDFGRLTYNSSTGTYNVAGITTAEIRNQLSATSTDFGRLTYNSSTGTYNVAGITTAEIRNQLSAGTGVGYSSGQFSIGQPVATTSNVTFGAVNSTGIITASHFAGSDFRDVDGSLVPLVGVQSATGNSGIVTAFKFVGTGLEEYKIENEIALIRVSGVAATTYVTSSVVTATQGQTSFLVSGGYRVGFVDAYLNGVRLVTGIDYSATDEANIVLSSPATAGDEIEMVSWKSLGDIIDVAQLRTAGNLTVGSAATITTDLLVNRNAFVTGIITASNFVGDGASLTNLTYQNITGKTAGVRTEFSVTSTDFGRLTYNSSTGTYNVAGITTAEIRNQLSATSTDFGRLTYNSSTGTYNVAGITTAEIRNQLSAGTGVGYSSGQFSIGQPVATTSNVTFNSVNVSAGATFGGNVIIGGDLTVNGTTTRINTVEMTVEDTLVQLQVVDGVAPTSATNKDVGIVLNYYDTSAKKAAMYWDDSAGRFVFSSNATETSGVITSSAYGALEVGSLWINDCAGQSQLISCEGTTRSLNNIVIDGGSF